MATLLHWHTRLDAHFKQLREDRATSGKHPLFVLEHGLDAAERAALSDDVQECIRRSAPSKVGYLPWVVYAAELGYRFAGEEFWQTFEEETPGWRENGNRAWLRSSFHSFARTYGGARPEGRWAHHFSIICWPITHAILPCDLQRQLAHALYDLRWVLRVEHFTEPATLGQLIRSRATSRSSRFATFAEDAPLVGQISAALLLKESSQTHHLIHGPALERIADDLDRERLARTWLADARARAAQVQLRGVTPVASIRATRAGAVTNHQGAGAATGPSALSTAAAGYRRSTLGIDPRLVLRPEGENKWSVDLEIPELQHLLDSPEWERVLTDARCRIAGGPRRPLAAGRLLYGTQRLALERWPRSDEVLLAFENAPPPIEAALKTTALLPSGPVWLFKLAADGRAHHIRSNVARPGGEYVLVSTTPLEYCNALKKVDVACAGVFGGSISVPEFVPPSVDALLNLFGIRRGSTIRLSPAGLPPLFWDGEGHVEWLTTDAPLIRIERQAVGEQVELALVGSPHPPVKIPGDAPPVAYVELPPLSAGAHTVLVQASGAHAPTTPAVLEVTIRAPRPWAGELGEQHAIQVATSPTAPTLEDLVLGRFRMNVRGPGGLRVTSSATLWDYQKRNAIHRKSLPTFQLPFDAGAWHRTFVRHFLDDQPVQDSMERAWAIEVQFAFGSFSTQRILFVRHLSPLRWMVRTRSRGRDVYLVDDTGLESTAAVTMRSFEEPAVAVPLPVSGGPAALEVPNAGGLLEAVQAEHRTTAVLAPRNVQGFGGLRVNPTLPNFRRAPDGMAGLVALARLWAEATPHGSQLARMRQCDTLRAVHGCLVRSLCGSNWEWAERTFLRDVRESAHALTLELTPDPKVRQLVREPIEQVIADLPGMSRESRAEFLHGLLTRVRDLRALDVADADFALAIMSVPEREGQVSDTRWRTLLDHSLLCRAARFMVVASHRASAVSDITAIPLYVGWD